MFKSKNSHHENLLLSAVLSSTLLLSACSDGDSNSSVQNAEFGVTITNLSAGQPMSPAAIVLHAPEWASFETGEAASLALEHLAESGDNSMLLDEVSSNSYGYHGVSGTGLILPGESETVQLLTSINNLGTLSLSAVSMLVNTNDAIAALNNESIASLGVNESLSFGLLSYDSGTEANSETEDTIPGPAASNGLQEGFNATRDDVRNQVYVHAGVVSQDDGLSTSTLSEVHRWSHNVAKITVERIR